MEANQNFKTVGNLQRTILWQDIIDSIEGNVPNYLQNWHQYKNYKGVETFGEI